MIDRPKVSTINPSLRDLQPPPGLGNAQVLALLAGGDEARRGEDLQSSYYASGERRRGKQGTSEDRDKLVTFEAAKAAAIRHGFTGVGVALLPGSTFVALDVDNVVDDPEIFKALRSALDNTYAEYSPSGKGVRAFVMQSDDISKVPRFQNLKSHASAGNDFTFEVLATQGFVTYTGHVLDPKARPKHAEAPSDAILKLYESRLAKRGPVFGKGVGDGALDAHSTTQPPVGYTIEDLHHVLKSFNPSASYDDWIEVGMCLHHETGGSQDGFDVWHTWSMAGDSYVSEGDCDFHQLSFRKTEGAKTMRTLMKKISSAGECLTTPRATADDFDDMTGIDDDEISDGYAEPEKRSTPIQAAEYLKRPPIAWLVRCLIQEGDPVNLFGPSGSGKSFIAFDIVMSIARGVAWSGLKVKQRRVVYICAEGAGGFRVRLDAYREYHQLRLEQIALHVIPEQPSLLKPKDIKDLTAAIEAIHGAEVIVIDTLAQTIPGGDENSSEDMGAALTAVQTLGKHFGATVILAHHTGKNVNRGARGWSGIKGAMGTQLEVIVQENGSRMLHVEKLKDGEGGANYNFKLHRVSLGKDEDGEEISSCVVVADGIVEAGRPETSARKRGGRIGLNEHLVMDALSRLEMGADPVTLSALIAATAGLMENPDGKPGWTFKVAAKRAIKTMVKKGLVDTIDGVYFGGQP